MARSQHPASETGGGPGFSGGVRLSGLTGPEGIAPFIAAMEKLTAALETARAQGVRTYRDLGSSVDEWSNIATKATSQALVLLTRHMFVEASSVATHSKAEQAKSLATLSALKQTAVYKAIAATAAGFQALGSFDFWAAAQDFTSAALWGAVAGSQIASSSAGGAGASGRSGHAHSLDRGGRYGESGASVGIGASELAGGAASAKYGPSGNLTVAIMGDNEAGEWLAKTLNTAVEQRGVQLTSTRSTRSAYAAG